MQRFGEKLRILRQRRGMTVKQLAIELGIKSDSHINDMEKGRNKPSVDLLLKIADYFQVTPNQLLLDEVELE